MNELFDDFLTIDELAEKLKVKKSWLYGRTREQGEDAIPKIRCGKYLRFSERAVMRWLIKKNVEMGL